MDKIFVQASSKNEVKDFDHLLRLLNEIVDAAPEFCVVPGREGEPIGVPMYVLFDLLSNTGAAYDLFRMTAFNAALKNLLKHGVPISSPMVQIIPSRPSLMVGLGSLASDHLNKTAATLMQTILPLILLLSTADTSPGTNSSLGNFGTAFALLRNRRIPTRLSSTMPASPLLITYHRHQTVLRRMISSGQPYSLWDMFDIGPDREYYVKKFEGGKVYQAFLSPQDYHRWHSPIHGTIVKTFILPGTYYAALPDEGVKKDNGERSYAGALIRSQAWLTTHATRAIIFIEADDTDIGLVCFIGVGMAEVSTCDVTVKEQQKVKPGDELGMFHFGGSSHTLIFGPNVNIKFFASVNKHAWINSPIAIVTKKPNADN
ncbi:L-tryptophan decarboxylase [Psilocybe cubensis]|uniref:L-tryptophan decarboxylase PsiD-like domain-containing protein n=2 Tax=Psilocybe cubensis TaxID=181762 RepID=A0A8H8CFW9_PSICU|nr:L-tryptophan decarboxylase [Psilocybe cubensis]KAH9477930.1 L-tryptophan decarboxylase [Psilocybe cubensis]